MDKFYDTKSQNEEDGLTFRSDQEAIEELESNKEHLEEKRRKYLSPFDTIEGEFDVFSLK